LVQQYVENKKLDLHLFTQQLSYQFNSQIDKKRNRLVRNHESLSFEAIKNVQKNTDHLNHQKQRLADLAPRRILQRGYAAVEQSGRRIRRADQLNVSQLFSLSFADDQIKISPKNDNYNE
jgi:exonuclease VII large subunit